MMLMVQTRSLPVRGSRHCAGRTSANLRLWTRTDRVLVVALALKVFMGCCPSQKEEAEPPRADLHSTSGIRKRDGCGQR